MERHKRKADATCRDKLDAKQDCDQTTVFPMALPNQVLNIPTFLNDDDCPSKVVLRHNNHIHQDSKKISKRRMPPIHNDSNYTGTPSLAPCATLDKKELSQVDSNQSLVECSPTHNHEGNIQRFATQVGNPKTPCTNCGESPILQLTSDIMAQIFAFLEPSAVFDVVSSPLCKRWVQSYTHDHDLWKVLCTMDPFKVDYGDKQALGKQEFLYYLIKVKGDLSFKVSRHRLLYISFVRCVNYLRSLKQGNRNTTSSMKPIDKSIGNTTALAAGGTPQQYGILDRGPLSNEVSPLSTINDQSPSQSTKRSNPSTNKNAPNKRPRYGKSMITTRLLGPSSTGTPSYLTLPRSCAIFSVVNWMVAHARVEGIQTMCIEALPQLLEDEQHRMTAQRAGLSDAVFRAMLTYPDSVNLHSAAFHTLVLLGRPLWGEEGMIIDCGNRALLRGANISAVTFLDLEAARGSRPEGRIPIVLDSMRRFEHEVRLQTRACWALVNLALIPSQRDIIIQNGGIEATLRAMQNHPKSHGVQFRALFALINLAVPCTNNNNSTTPAEPLENKILDTCVEKMAKLVVSAVMNFQSCSSIRNKACLVLHNLSVSNDYISTLLWTRHCYNLLCWSAKNDTNDQVLQRSSIAAQKRMNDYMCHREGMESEFSIWIDKEPELPSFFHDIP